MFLIICFIALIVSVVPLPAQDFREGGEFFGLIGYGKVFDAEGSGALFLGNILFHISGNRVQPYLMGGAGLLHYRNELETALPRRTITGTGLAFNLGAGVKVFTRAYSRRWQAHTSYLPALH